MIHRRRVCALMFVLSTLATEAAWAEDPGGKKKGGGLSYLQFQTLTATVIRSSGRRGVLTVEAGLDIPSVGLRTRALQIQPRLRAAYVQRLQIYVSGLPPEVAPDPDYLSRALQQETDRLLGEPGAHFLLGAILVN